MDVMMSVLMKRGRLVVHVPIVYINKVSNGKIPTHDITDLFHLGIKSG